MIARQGELPEIKKPPENPGALRLYHVRESNP